MKDDFWKKYYLDNGEMMSQRQAKKIDRLEEEIADYLERIQECKDEIMRIRSWDNKRTVLDEGLEVAEMEDSNV
jgi:hypothetical protein